MNNDTALILLLADMQREIEGLRAENTALREQVAPTSSNEGAPQ